MKRIKLARMNPEQVADEIGDFIIHEISSIGYTGGVIGLSGGVDSTTTAALAKRAFDKNNLQNEKKLELIGYILPSSTNSPADAEDGKRVAERLGIEYRIIDIQPFVESCRIIIPNTFNSNFHKGNLMSEIRALVLRREAATEKKLVIGTGNKDEDFGVGYYTLFGDGAVHFSPIGNLSKRLVKDMARYQGFADLANRVPTAGLEPGQTDFKDLGYRYETEELVMNGIEQGLYLEEILNDPSFISFSVEDLQEYEKTFGEKKFHNSREIIFDIKKRNEVANAKAGIVHPPKANVTLSYEEEK